MKKCDFCNRNKTIFGSKLKLTTVKFASGEYLACKRCLEKLINDRKNRNKMIEEMV